MPITQPGVYRLTQDIVNPAADRRKRHDWRAVLSFAENTRFIVEHNISDVDIAEVRGKPIGYIIRLAKAPYTHQDLRLRLDGTRWHGLSDREAPPDVLAVRLAEHLALVTDEAPEQYETICPDVRLDDAKLIVELAEQRLRGYDYSRGFPDAAHGPALRRIIEQFTR